MAEAMLVIVAKACCLGVHCTKPHNTDVPVKTQNTGIKGAAEKSVWGSGGAPAHTRHVVPMKCTSGIFFRVSNRFNIPTGASHRGITLGRDTECLSGPTVV